MVSQSDSAAVGCPRARGVGQLLSEQKWVGKWFSRRLRRQTRTSCMPGLTGVLNLPLFNFKKLYFVQNPLADRSILIIWLSQTKLDQRDRVEWAICPPAQLHDLHSYTTPTKTYTQTCATWTATRYWPVYVTCSLCVCCACYGAIHLFSRVLQIISLRFLIVVVVRDGICLTFQFQANLPQFSAN